MTNQHKRSKLQNLGKVVLIFALWFLLYPVVAFSGYTDYINGESRKGCITKYRHLGKFQCLCGKWKEPEVDVISEFVCLAGGVSKQSIQWASAGIRDCWKIGRTNTQRVLLNFCEHSHKDSECVVFSSKEDNLVNWLANVSFAGWDQPFLPGENGSYEINTLFEGVGEVQNVCDSCVNINIVDYGKSGSNEKGTIIYSANLTNGVYPFARAPLAVGGNNDTVFSSTNNDSSTFGGIELYARYVKDTYNGYTLKDGALTYTSCKDVDISEDGEHWFHLLGQNCVWGYPRLRMVK